VSKSLKTLAVLSVLGFGTAVSGTAFAECSWGNHAQTGDMTTIAETGDQSTATEEKGES